MITFDIGLKFRRNSCIISAMSIIRIHRVYAVLTARSTDSAEFVVGDGLLLAPGAVSWSLLRGLVSVRNPLNECEVQAMGVIEVILSLWCSAYVVEFKVAETTIDLVDMLVTVAQGPLSVCLGACALLSLHQ